MTPHSALRTVLFVLSSLLTPYRAEEKHAGQKVPVCLRRRGRAENARALNSIYQASVAWWLGPGHQFTPRMEPSTSPTATPTTALREAETSAPTATPTPPPTGTVGCSDTFTLAGYHNTLAGYHNSSYDGCYHAFGDGDDERNWYGLDGVSDVNAYLSGPHSDPTGSIDELGPVFWIDYYISDEVSRWTIGRMYRSDHANFVQREYYQVDETDPETLRPWEVDTWEKKSLSTIQDPITFSVTQGCSDCPPPWPSSEVESTSSSTGQGGATAAIVMIPLAIFVVLAGLAFWKHKKSPTPVRQRSRAPASGGGGVDPCATPCNAADDITQRVSVTATTLSADRAAASTTAVSASPPIPTAAADAGATVVVSAVAAPPYVPGGGYVPRSDLHAVLGSNAQHLPTAVAVPYADATESELMIV